MTCVTQLHMKNFSNKYSIMAAFETGFKFTLLLDADIFTWYMYFSCVSAKLYQVKVFHNADLLRGAALWNTLANAQMQKKTPLYWGLLACWKTLQTFVIWIFLIMVPSNVEEAWTLTSGKHQKLEIGASDVEISLVLILTYFLYKNFSKLWHKEKKQQFPCLSFPCFCLSKLVKSAIKEWNLCFWCF